MTAGLRHDTREIINCPTGQSGTYTKECYNGVIITDQDQFLFLVRHRSVRKLQYRSNGKKIIRVFDFFENEYGQYRYDMFLLKSDEEQCFFFV